MGLVTGWDHVTQVFIHSGLENVKGRRPHSLPVQPFPMPCCLDCEQIFPYIQSELLSLQLTRIASVSRHATLWEPGSVFLIAFLQVLEGCYFVSPKLCFLQAKQASFAQSVLTGHVLASWYLIICTIPCLSVARPRDQA